MGSGDVELFYTSSTSKSTSTMELLYDTYTCTGNHNYYAVTCADDISMNVILYDNSLYTISINNLSGVIPANDTRCIASALGNGMSGNVYLITTKNTVKIKIVANIISGKEWGGRFSIQCVGF